jgi:hypothetical protein
MMGSGEANYFRDYKSLGPIAKLATSYVDKGYWVSVVFTYGRRQGKLIVYTTFCTLYKRREILHLFLVPYSKWSRDLAIGGEKSAANYIDSHRPSGTRAHVQDDYRLPPS